jgi:hypothetical protein
MTETGLPETLPPGDWSWLFGRPRVAGPPPFTVRLAGPSVPGFSGITIHQKPGKVPPCLAGPNWAKGAS